MEDYIRDLKTRFRQWLNHLVIADLASNMKYEKIKFGEAANSLNTIANLSKVYFSKEFLFFGINTCLIILLTFNLFYGYLL